MPTSTSDEGGVARRCAIDYSPTMVPERLGSDQLPIQKSRNLQTNRMRTLASRPLRCVLSAPLLLLAQDDP
eukprot:6718904-Pyramimonas_sp.AAC.1